MPIRRLIIGLLLVAGLLCWPTLVREWQYDEAERVLNAVTEICERNSTSITAEDLRSWITTEEFRFLDQYQAEWSERTGLPVTIFVNPRFSVRVERDDTVTLYYLTAP